jgi:hypothetical protein
LRFSCVNGSEEASGASSGIEGVVDFGGVAAVVAVSAGEPERVEGALTAVESFVDVVDSEVCDPVRRSEAARRGRAGDDDCVPVLPLLRLIRAASWFKDGGRTADDGRSGFGACIDACNEFGGLDMVVRLKSAIAPNQSTDNNTSTPLLIDIVSGTRCLSTLPPIFYSSTDLRSFGIVAKQEGGGVVIGLKFYIQGQYQANSIS